MSNSMAFIIVVAFALQIITNISIIIKSKKRKRTKSTLSLEQMLNKLQSVRSAASDDDYDDVAVADDYMGL